MTMLDRMRRHRNWLKWSLGLVVLAFVVFYIPDFLQQDTVTVGASAREVIAEVDGRPLTAGEFQQRYAAQVQAYRTQFGGAMNDQLLRQLNVDQQILTQMIDEEVAVVEAERQGIEVSDDELAQQIFAIPGTAGERPVHRRGALRAAAPQPEPAAEPRPVRRSHAPQPGDRSAADGGDRLDCGVGR